MNNKKWISVEDKVPVGNTRVLCCNKRGYMSVCWYDHSSKLWIHDVSAAALKEKGITKGLTPTHWMPLPLMPESK